MPQIFRPSSNKFSQFSIIYILLVVLSTALGAYAYFRSDYYTRIGHFVEQPIPFSHKHHVRGLGLNCLFCHSAVEKSTTAGMPSTEVCMSCHQQLYKNSNTMKLLQVSYHKNIPIQWNRVHKLPDYVYFNHSVHIKNGVSCVSCHGDVKNMPLTSQHTPMTMQWCLQCHNNVEQYVGKTRAIKDHERLNDCYTCHR